MSPRAIQLRRYVDCLDGRRVPLNKEQRASIPGDIPYWGANGIVDWVERPLFDGELVLLGEDGAPFDDPRRPVAFRVNEPVWVNNHIHVLRPRSNVDARYLSYALNVVDWMPFVTGSTRLKLTQDDMLEAPVTARDLASQRAIADFLDTETARIDALIAKKRRMIELLDERIRVLMEAVLTQAAVEEVPFRRLLLRSPSYGATETGSGSESGWPRYIRITDLTDSGELRPDGAVQLAPDLATGYMLEDGDLLLARSGATVGKSFLYREGMGPAAFAGYLIQFRIDRNKMQPELLEAWTHTRHYWTQVELAALQATIENVSAEKYKEFKVPLVPTDLQAGIVAGLAHARESVMRTRRAIETQLRLLQEHRRALITAAVTGELEVAGVAA